MPTTPDTYSCRCATVRCTDCGWDGLATRWTEHHRTHRDHTLTAVTPFCGETPCRTVAAERAGDRS